PTDPTPGNDTSTDENTPDPEANLSITKTVDKTKPRIDEEVVFTLTVNNDGPSDAINVVVTDQLPNGYAFVSAAPSIGTYTAATGVWAVGTLTAAGPGATATLDI